MFFLPRVLSHLNINSFRSFPFPSLVLGVLSPRRVSIHFADTIQTFSLCGVMIFLQKLSALTVITSIQNFALPPYGVGLFPPHTTLRITAAQRHPPATSCALGGSNPDMGLSESCRSQYYRSGQVSPLSPVV